MDRKSYTVNLCHFTDTHFASVYCFVFGIRVSIGIHQRTECQLWNHHKWASEELVHILFGNKWNISFYRIENMLENVYEHEHEHEHAKREDTTLTRYVSCHHHNLPSPNIIIWPISFSNIRQLSASFIVIVLAFVSLLLLRFARFCFHSKNPFEFDMLVFCDCCSCCCCCCLAISFRYFLVSFVCHFHWCHGR